MATLQIIEYASIGNDARGLVPQVAQLPALATQNITISGTSAQSAAFNKDTRFVCLIGDVAYRFLAGSNPTASSTDQRRPADSPEYFGVTPSIKIAAITE